MWKRSRITWALAQELAASGVVPSAVTPGVPSVVAPEAPSATSRVPPEALPMDPPGDPSGVIAPDGPPPPAGSGQAAASVAAEAALGQVRRSKGCLVSLPAIWTVCGADSLRPEVCQQQINAHADFQHEVPEPRPACCGPEPGQLLAACCTCGLMRLPGQGSAQAAGPQLVYYLLQYSGLPWINDTAYNIADPQDLTCCPPWCRHFLQPQCGTCAARTHPAMMPHPPASPHSLHSTRQQQQQQQPGLSRHHLPSL